MPSVAVKVAVAAYAPRSGQADSVPPVTVMPAPLPGRQPSKPVTASLKLNVTSELLSASLSEASTMSTATVGLRVSIGDRVGAGRTPRLPATSV